jgi:hypothetical protein
VFYVVDQTTTLQCKTNNQKSYAKLSVTENPQKSRLLLPVQTSRVDFMNEHAKSMTSWLLIDSTNKASQHQESG